LPGTPGGFWQSDGLCAPVPENCGADQGAAVVSAARSGCHAGRIYAGSDNARKRELQWFVKPVNAGENRARCFKVLIGPVYSKFHITKLKYLIFHEKYCELYRRVLDKPKVKNLIIKIVNIFLRACLFAIATRFMLRLCIQSEDDKTRPDAAP